MYMTPDKTHVQIRRARANLAALCSREGPTIILCQHQPKAILTPIPSAFSLSAQQRRRLRPQMRTQFARLLLELLPEGR